jgi:hypothetical protein
MLRIVASHSFSSTSARSSQATGNSLSWQATDSRKAAVVVASGQATCILLGKATVAVSSQSTISFSC